MGAGELPVRLGLMIALHDMREARWGGGGLRGMWSAVSRIVCLECGLQVWLRVQLGTFE